MKTELIKPKQNLILKPTEDTQFVLDFGAIKKIESGKENMAGINAAKRNNIKIGRYKTALILEKEGVSADLYVLYKLEKGANLDFSTEAVHTVPNTACNTIVRGVLLDKSMSTYVGKIVIHKNARQTNSYLDDKVLVVGKDTQNRSQPILEIEADDVKASHEATTGNIDKSQIYYLMSRGLSEKEAKELLIRGFFESTLDKITDIKIRQKLQKKLLL